MIDVTKSLKSFRFALKGIGLFFKNENNARVHLLASIVVVAAGVYFRIDRFEWMWVICAIALVWVTESVNTAIEKLVDLVSPEFNPKAGAIKDLAAAAVLFAAVAAALIGALIFWPHFTSYR